MYLMEPVLVHLSIYIRTHQNRFHLYRCASCASVELFLMLVRLFYLFGSLLFADVFVLLFFVLVVQLQKLGLRPLVLFQVQLFRNLNLYRTCLLQECFQFFQNRSFYLCRSWSLLRFLLVGLSWIFTSVITFNVLVIEKLKSFLRPLVILFKRPSFVLIFHSNGLYLLVMICPTLFSLFEFRKCFILVPLKHCNLVMLGTMLAFLCQFYLFAMVQILNDRFYCILNFCVFVLDFTICNLFC